MSITDVDADADLIFEPATKGLERPTGLRPTLRQLMILTVALAVVLSVDRSLVGTFGGIGIVLATLFTIMVAPWILGALLAALDRYSPVRYWLGTLIAVLSAPFFLLYFDGAVVANWLRDGTQPNLPLAAALNLFIPATFAISWRALKPRSCPTCERISLIPLMRFCERRQRTANVRWCASCGSRYWRDPSGAWVPDQRRTW